MNMRKIFNGIMFTGLLLALFAFYGCAGARIDIKTTPVKKEYKGASSVTLFDISHTKLNTDGSYEHTCHKAVKVFNVKGRKMYSAVSTQFCKDYGTSEIKYIRVYKPNGEIVNVSKKKIQTMPMPALGKFFLDKIMISKVEIPDLENNCIIEYEIVDHFTNPPMKNNYWDFLLFEDFQPIVKKIVLLEYPESMNIKYELLGEEGIKVDKAVKGKKKILKFSMENIEKIKAEPMMPPLNKVGRRVLITSTESWKDISKWAYELYEPKMEATGPVKEKVEELIKDITGREEKIEKIFRFVCDEIRYVEVGMVGKKGGFEPYAAEYTLKNKYGVCRDKAVLMAAMLECIGEDAYVVLTNPMYKIDTVLPLSLFNHAITAIKEKDGKYRFIDSTTFGANVDLPEMERDKIALVMTKDGESWTNTGKKDPYKNLMLVNIQSNIKRDLSSKNIFSIEMNGDMAMSMRNAKKYLKDMDISDMLEQIVKQFAEDAKVDKKESKIEIPDDFNKPVIMRIVFTTANVLQKSGKYYKFNLGDASSMGSGGPGYFNLEKRKYPLKIDMGMVAKATIEINYPSNIKPKSYPKKYNFKSDYMDLSSNYSLKKGRLTLTSDSIMFPATIMPKDYVTEKEKYDEFEKNTNSDIIFIKR